MKTLTDRHPLLETSPYQSYAYGYPHKTAYRPLSPATTLRQAWADEDRASLFLYLHVPFCEQRCGFCNLFTTVIHDQNRPRRYLDALTRHAKATRCALGDDAAFHRLAIGGGTPTYLEPDELARLMDIVTDVMHVDPRTIPTSVETSPATATKDRLALLRHRGVDRISIGIQTFDEAESKRLGRTQRNEDVHRALAAIREANFPTLNIDLIYGGDTQTAATWLASIEQALRYQPQELYLYPLYVRPCTGLAKLQREWDDQRIALYRLGRDRLREAGYEQVSMRMFQHRSTKAASGPVYCCQDDGMVGLGCGARSYTRSLHYSSEYAVGRAGVAEILNSYMERNPDSFERIEYGVHLEREEQQRRFVLMSLLQVQGLNLHHYQQRFGTDALNDLPMLTELGPLGLATRDATQLVLTDAGIERSDAIGPWLCSDAVRKRMEEWAWR